MQLTQATINLEHLVRFDVSIDKSTAAIEMEYTTGKTECYGWSIRDHADFKERAQAVANELELAISEGKRVFTIHL